MNRLIRRRRRTVPRRQAAEALQQARCMFSVHGDCDSYPLSVGLRDDYDIDAVLVCRRHLPHLRRLRPYEAERLARYLRVTFAHKLGAVA